MPRILSGPDRRDAVHGNLEFAIIGAGRVGTSLGVALSVRGHTLKALTCRTLASARQSQKIIGQGVALTDKAKAARLADILFLCLPDEKIALVAKSLAQTGVAWSRKTVFHTSGLLPAHVLAPLQKKGAAIASFHPVQSFPSKSTPLSRWAGIYVGIEGDRMARRVATSIAHELGARPFLIPAHSKPAYHAACSIASGFFVVLLDAALQLLRDAGFKASQSRRLLFPLVEGTLQNVKQLDTRSSLTGPIARGDVTSIRKHLQALSARPELMEAYRCLCRLALKQAKKSSLTRPKIRALKSLLGGR